MGYHKRTITKDVILLTKDRYLKGLFSCDTLIFDGWSSKFYGYYLIGMKKDEILDIMNDFDYNNYH